MGSLLFILFAAVFKAVADTLQFHYYTSVFSNTEYFSENFWNRDKSSKYAKRIANYPVDAWHVSNSAMIISFCIAVLLAPQSYQWLINHWYFYFPIMGVLFVVVFNTCLNKIFKA